MKTSYLKNLNLHKYDPDKQRQIKKAVAKLTNLLCAYDSTKHIANNPTIHDSYGDFFAFKYLSGHGCNLRLLYRVIDDTIEVHSVYFKLGQRDDSKYIQQFERYVNDYRKARGDAA